MAAREGFGEQLAWELARRLEYKAPFFSGRGEKSRGRVSTCEELACFPSWSEGGGGGGYSTEFYTARLHPVVNPYHFIYHFRQKRYPFPIPSIGEWYPFQIPDLERCTLFSCCKCTHRFEIWWNHKTRKVSRLYHSHKFLCQPLWVFLQTERQLYVQLIYFS